MDDYAHLTCPNCQRSNLKVRTSSLGLGVRCKHCQHAFLAAEATITVSRPDQNSAGNMAEVLDGIQVLEQSLEEQSRLRENALARVEDSEADLRAGSADARRADDLEAELREVRAEAEQEAGRAEEAATLRAERDRLSDERDGLAARLDELNEEVANLRLELDQGREAVEAREAELASIRLTLAETTEARDDLRAECDRLTVELETIHARASLMREEAKAQQGDRHQVMEWLRTAEFERDALRAEVEQGKSARLEVVPASFSEGGSGPPAAEVVRLSIIDRTAWSPPGSIAPGGPRLSFDMPDLDPNAPAPPEFEHVNEEDQRYVDLVNLAVELKNEIALLTKERDAWKIEAERVRSSSPEPTAKFGSASVDEAALARVSAALQRETERADALQAKLNDVYSEALVDLTEGEDDSLALDRFLSDARAEIERLRASLSELGDSPEDPRTTLIVKMS